MASSRVGKFYNLLENQERFRTNLESIINKYDKPFEDSPILDIRKLDKISVPDEFDYFSTFGRTPLATDLQKGKKRKGGVSTDSALGSTLSLCNNMSEESSGNINLQSYDFTHEDSDALGGFIRYKHQSVLKKPQIAGLITADGDLDEFNDSEENLGSICSGPTSLPYRGRLKDTERVEDDKEDASDSGRTSQTDSIPVPDLDVSSSQDKVRSWLSDDAFRSRHSSVDTDDESEDEESLFESDDISQDDYPSTMSDDSGESPAMSLLEVKERFVRRVQSILVEENNETDDITTSADEDGDFPYYEKGRFPPDVVVGRAEAEKGGIPRGDCVKAASYQKVPSSTFYEEPSSDRGWGNQEPSERSNIHKSIDTNAALSQRLVKRPLSSTLCCEAPSIDRGERDLGCYQDKTLILGGDETKILAGHYGDVTVSPKKGGRGEAMALGAGFQKGFELVHSPSGKMEWESCSRKGDSADPALPKGPRLECGESKQSNVTPRKALFPSDLTDQTFKTPQGKSTFKFKNPRTPSNTIPAQDIMTEIMDFFKSPLPQILTSPMPILSPRGRLRTAEGKPVAKCAASRAASTNQESSSLKSKQLQSIIAMKQNAPQGRSSHPRETSSLFSTHERTVITPSKCHSKDTSSNIQQLHGAHKKHSPKDCVGTEEEVEIFLFTDESLDDASPIQHQSPSRNTNPSQSLKTSSQLPNSGKKLCKIPRTPSSSTIPFHKHDILSETPGIISPFSHMQVHSAGKGQMETIAGQENKDKMPRNKEGRMSRPAKSLMFEGTKQRDSKDDSELDTGLLVMMSSDDDDDVDIEMESSFKEETNRSRAEINSKYRSSGSLQKTTSRKLPSGLPTRDKPTAKERQSSDCGSKEAVKHSCDSVKEMSESRPEAALSVEAQSMRAGFQHTYIIAGRDKRTSAPHLSSPACKPKVKEQQYYRREEETSIHQPTRGKLTKDSNKKYAVRHGHKFSHKSPSAKNKNDHQNHHLTKQIKQHSAAFDDKGCTLEKRHESVPASYQRESTLHGYQGYRSRKVDKAYSGSEDSANASSEFSSSDEVKEHRPFTTSRTHGDPSSKRNDNSVAEKTEDERKQMPSACSVEDSSGSRSTKPKRSSRHRVVLEDRVPQVLTTAKVRMKDAPLLSSTRIDEDQVFAEQVEVKPKRVPRKYGDAHQEDSIETRKEIPSKRRRQGSDRANSLESPAKKPLNATRSSHTASKTLDRCSQIMGRKDQLKDKNSQPSEVNSQSPDRNCKLKDRNSRPLVRIDQKNRNSQPMTRNIAKDKSSHPREIRSKLEDRKSQSASGKSHQWHISKQSEYGKSQPRKKTSKPPDRPRCSPNRNTSASDESSQPRDSISSQSWDRSSQTSDMSNQARQSRIRVNGSNSQLSRRSHQLEKNPTSSELSDSSEEEGVRMLSLSSICEGPGKCVKKICFKCVMR